MNTEEIELSVLSSIDRQDLNKYLHTKVPSAHEFQQEGNDDTSNDNQLIIEDL